MYIYLYEEVLRWVTYFYDMKRKTKRVSCCHGSILIFLSIFARCQRRRSAEKRVCELQLY